MEPYTKKDFAWVSWTPSKINLLADSAIREKYRIYKEIKSVSSKDRTFKNTIYALESSNYGLEGVYHRINILMNASPKKTIREAAHKAIDRMAKKLIDMEYDEDIYKAVKEFEKKNIALEGEDKKLFKDIMRSFRRSGFGLSKAKREVLKKNLKRLGTLSIKFSKNIADYQDHILLEEEDTKGLSKSYLESLTKDSRGRYRVTLQYPDRIPFMHNSENRTKRRELLEKSMKQGSIKNIELLEAIVDLRDKNARILGYKNHAEYKIEVKTAKTPKRVMEFIESLLNGLKKPLQKDLEKLNEAKKKHLGDNGETLELEDIAFYSEKLKKEEFNVDEEKIREYFPIEKVKEGTFKIYSKLLSVNFRKVRGYPTWHEDAEIYLVENISGDPIAYFILDLYPREGKFSHAAVFDIEPGRSSGEGYVKPISCMLANFNKPSRNKPSLLSHGEIETFFHEFGHLMHVCLTKARYMSQSGTHIAWDFVEAPSQMLEYWVWDEKMLGLLSGHYKTGHKLPKSLMKSIIVSKDHMRAYIAVRQLSLALFDMRLHMQKISNIPALYDKTEEEFFGFKNPKNNIWPAGFGHMIGYSAGYYGYMWSKVFAADMFTRFKKEGLLNKKTGGDYRKWILEKGSSMEELDLVKKFLGRDPNNRAFLKELGV